MLFQRVAIGQHICVRLCYILHIYYTYITCVTDSALRASALRWLCWPGCGSYRRCTGGHTANTQQTHTAHCLRLDMAYLLSAEPPVDRCRTDGLGFVCERVRFFFFSPFCRLGFRFECVCVTLCGPAGLTGLQFRMCSMPHTCHNTRNRVLYAQLIRMHREPTRAESRRSYPVSLTHSSLYYIVYIYRIYDTTKYTVTALCNSIRSTRRPFENHTTHCCEK